MDNQSINLPRLVVLPEINAKSTGDFRSDFIITLREMANILEMQAKDSVLTKVLFNRHYDTTKPYSHRQAFAQATASDVLRQVAELAERV